ncbi:MAG TPA: NlpC/P60 family protein, partial [Jatrophihabitans sp.]|nr:NlpC/P60 family protein [Jatrophihabitans sp.]
TRLVEYVQATYMSGEIDGTAGSLLTANDPSELLQQSTLDQYQQLQKADAVGAYQQAAVAQSNKDAAARRAENAAAAAKQRAEEARQAARVAVQAAKDQKAALDQVMASKQTQLTAATNQFNSLRYGHQQWLNYLSRRNAYNVALGQWQDEQARLARLRAIREAQRHSGGGSSGGGGGGGYTPPPSGGGWTPAKGWRAAHRALSQQGVMYAWAGGGAFGPSRGVCDPGNGAANDCNVVGFDCSGLAMYAWGASWWAHYAATQYVQAGSYHPGAGNLAAGDLIFWSSNGSIGGIHHVAVYIGGDQIVEAPFSGASVRVASLWEYGGFFGATRPGT